MLTMKAIQIPYEGGAFELVERPVPEPQAGQVRLKVEACGICHSDTFVKEGGFFPINYPRIPGHEVIGIIDAVGKGVDSTRIGQRVGVGWHGGHCFVCSACRQGDFFNCENAPVTGFSYDGGYAEYMVTSQEALVLIPEQLKAAEAAPILCAGVTTFIALRNSVAKPGDLVAVQGLGGLGHLAVQFASQCGFRTVAISRGKDKEALARQLGADEYIDTNALDPAQELLRMGGAQVVLTTAPNSTAVASLIPGLGRNGQIITLASAPDAVNLDLTSLIVGSHSIQGWAAAASADIENSLNFSVLRHVLPLVENFPLDRVDEAYQRMVSNQVRFRAVLVP